MDQLERAVVMFAAIFLLAWFGFVIWLAFSPRPSRPIDLDAHLSATVRDGKEVTDPPDDLRVPIEEVVRWAERRAIAEHCPLDGDPHQAGVVANSGGTQVVLPPGATYTPFGPRSWTGIPLTGGGGPPGSYVEVTAFGDYRHTYIPGPPVASPTVEALRQSWQAIPHGAGLRFRWQADRQILDALTARGWLGSDGKCLAEQLLAEMDAIERGP